MRILVILLSCYLSSPFVFAQKSNSIDSPKNAFLVNIGAVFPVSTGFGLDYRYERTITEVFIAEDILFDLTPYMSIGYNDETKGFFKSGIDRKTEILAFNLGAITAFKFFDKHQLEAGYFVSHVRWREAYLAFTDEEFTKETHLRLNMAYRFELKHFLFRISINPTPDKSSPSGYFFGPGIGIGFRI